MPPARESQEQRHQTPYRNAKRLGNQGRSSPKLSSIFPMIRTKAFLIFLHKKYVLSVYDRRGAGGKGDFLKKLIENEVPVLAFFTQGSVSAITP